MTDNEIDFDKIKQSVAAKIDALYSGDDSSSALLKIVCKQALMVSIECLEEYHEQQMQVSEQ